MTEKKLTAKQKAFCEEYLIDLNATQAAIRAGYSEDTAHQIGYENLIKHDVAAEIERLQKIRSDITSISAESVLRRINLVANRCMQAEAVKDSDGDETGEYKFEHSGANKALEMLARHNGLFNDKVEVKTTHDIDKLELAMQKLKEAGIDPNAV